MSVENNGNSHAVQHLINLEKSVAIKGNEYHKTIITALGEAGDSNAVQHLINLEKSVTVKGNAYHKAIITAIGRAGRIS